ncbi:MAG: 4Fe-4S binding protein [Spirochaetaceae bacterium]
MAHNIISTCIGCGACKKVCPTTAITGDKKSLHVIDYKLCIDCGSCGRVCPKDSIETEQGDLVPRLKKSEWLKPTIIVKKCYACENCVVACPVDALTMKAEDLPLNDNYAVLAYPNKCVSCNWCLDNCQFDAIIMEVQNGNN